ncbi:hypothetical protein [Streptomyces sp. AK08-01B]|uniref:hypothetical protein n=1 Tax=unclassified Streptomyces TaxID=2593676 RepID=UPI0039F4F06F
MGLPGVIVATRPRRVDDALPEAAVLHLLEERAQRHFITVSSAHLVALPGEGVLLPAPQAHGVAEALKTPEAPRSVQGGENGESPVEVPAGYPVPVVSLQVGQEHRVEVGGELIDGKARVLDPPRQQPTTQMRVPTTVQEVRVGEQGQGDSRPCMPRPGAVLSPRPSCAQPPEKLAQDEPSMRAG